MLLGGCQDFAEIWSWFRPFVGVLQAGVPRLGEGSGPGGLAILGLAGARGHQDRERNKDSAVVFGPAERRPVASPGCWWDQGARVLVLESLSWSTDTMEKEVP